MSSTSGTLMPRDMHIHPNLTSPLSPPNTSSHPLRNAGLLGKKVDFSQSQDSMPLTVIAKFYIALKGYCCCLAAQSCPTLCDPMDWCQPGSSVHGILEARILGWVAFPSPGGLPHPGIKLESPALAGGFFATEPSGKSPQRIVGVLIFLIWLLMEIENS